MAGAESVFLGLAKEQFGLILGIGVGEALAAALEPQAVAIRQAEYKADPNVAVDPGTAALIVAEAVELRDWGAAEAQQFGIDGDRFDAIIGEALNAPDVSTLYTLFRRGLIDQAGFVHGLRKAKLEGRWDEALLAAKNVLLSSEELANAQQQQFIDEARANEEAALQGVTAERQQIRFRLAGLPPGVQTAQQYLNRGLIDDATFAQMVAEGHTKTKYTDVLRRGARFVLSPINYVEGRLRGWLTDAEMYAGTSLHGVTQADTDLLFKIHGRPISFRQTFIGTRRGGTLDGPIGDIDPAFLASLRRSNIQPPFYNLAWAQRHSLPSAFVMRALTEAGTWSAAKAEARLLMSGWIPEDAKEAAADWAGGSGSAGSKQTKTELLAEYAGGYVTQDELRTTLAALGYTGAALDREVHLADARRNAAMRERVVKVIGDAYRMHAIDETAAASELAEVNVLGDAATMLIALWEKERRFTRRELTDRQVASAFKKGLLARDAALAELEERGFTAEDAARELAI